MIEARFRSRARRADGASLRAGCIALGLCATLAGCVGVGLGVPRQAFTASSLDANRGARHRVALEGSDLGVVADRAIELGRTRELTLVKQSECSGAARRCELALRGKPVDRRIFRNAQTAVLSYFSRYFVSLERDPTGARVLVSAVGVPVLGGEMACPPALATELACKAPMLNRHDGRDLTASVRREWGYDISGTGEAEILQGLLDELRRSPRTGAPAGRRAIVAVFDVEDQARALGAAALAQLTEYLATKVTQAGYQVVPRDQLRSRIAAEKRESYKHCFEQRCQIELGRALAAQKSLATKLLRVGGQCVLTSQLYDLKSETAERAGSAKSASCGEAALLTAIDELARQLAGP